MKGAILTTHYPFRQKPAHPRVVQIPNRPIIIFVTVCTAKGKRILCRPESHAFLRHSWEQADDWVVGRYVIMPDHLHLFCAPARSDSAPLGRWVHFWKSLASRAWPWPEEQPVWQKSFWDTQLRRGEQYEPKWEYVRDNPLRKGLANSAEEWPFQGELHALPWH